MPVRYPKNQVKAKLFTNGGEFIYKSSGLDYTGYYHTINNKAYAGPIALPDVPQIELDVNPNILPIGADTNTLNAVGNAVGFFTQAYNFAKSNIAIADNIKDKIFLSKSLKKTSDSLVPRTGMHYFVQQINDPAKIIKEIDVNTYNSLQKDPIYKTVQINFSSLDADKQIKDGEKQIPGLKSFLEL
jgi:hypothetical protein